MRAYSMDFRQRIFDDLDRGHTTRQVATKFNVSESWIRRLKQRLRESGESAPRVRKPNPPSWLAHADTIRAGVAEQPDATLEELRRKLHLPMSAATLCRALQALKLVIKKKVLRAAELDRPDVQEKRAAWLAERLSLPIESLVFIDETWVNTAMTRGYGRCLIGQRLLDAVPYSRWKTTTFIAALRHNGLTAPTVVEGSMDGAVFVAYLKQQLAPTLQPGDIVVMDNLSSHKVAGVREAIQAVGADIAYLPPYSPDLNPIELVFSKVKRVMRTAARRTQQAMEDSLGQLIDDFGTSECQNYFRHCGYKVFATPA